MCKFGEHVRLDRGGKKIYIWNLVGMFIQAKNQAVGIMEGFYRIDTFSVCKCDKNVLSERDSKRV